MSEEVETEKDFYQELSEARYYTGALDISLLDNSVPENSKFVGDLPEHLCRLLHFTNTIKRRELEATDIAAKEEMQAQQSMISGVMALSLAHTFPSDKYPGYHYLKCDEDFKVYACRSKMTSVVVLSGADLFSPDTSEEVN